MRKLSLALILTIPLCLLSSCLEYSDSSADYEEGYDAGYDAGIADAYYNPDDLVDDFFDYFEIFYDEGYLDGKTASSEHMYKQLYESDSSFVVGAERCRIEIFNRLLNASDDESYHIIYAEETLSTDHFDITFSPCISEGNVAFTYDLTLHNYTIQEAYESQSLFFYVLGDDDRGNEVTLMSEDDYYEYAVLGNSSLSTSGTNRARGTVAARVTDNSHWWIYSVIVIDGEFNIVECFFE